MLGKPRDWMLIGVLLSWMTAAGMAQITTTQVADTIYHADGTTATGTVLISWPAFTTSSGASVAGGSTSAAIGAGGALSVALAPNAGSTPMGSYYTAVFHLDDGSVQREYWVVPVSAGAVKISAIESTVLPTSVAMQTVSKSYVDTAIAEAVTGHLDTTPYVLKAGDTMTGPLVLPADPTSALQAADKNYVDESIAGVGGGLGQKVSTQPSGTQTVTQPGGTELQVNHLNGVLYADQYINGRGDNGIANASGTADCSGGCEIEAKQDDPSTEQYGISGFASQTHVKDNRGGREVDSFVNPLDTVTHGLSVGHAVDDVSTQSEASLFQQTGNQIPGAIAMSITQEGLAGGSNLFPEQINSVEPYFKMGYSALSIKGTYNTQGQHGLVPQEIDCYGVGDCLMGSRFIYASGGLRDSADEGAHPFDLQTHEDTHVFEGGCIGGCTTGSTSLMIREDAGGGTQGDGRFLIDLNPAKIITSASTGGALIGGSPGTQHATAQFSGTNFPVSVFLSTGQVIPSQANNLAPGTVTFAIATTGVPSGYAVNTAAIGASSGLACVVDQTLGYAPQNYEMAPYTVVDGTHLQMTLNKPHQALATLAFGGLCGYGLEQTVDTANGIRQLFPVVGAYSATGIYYSGLSTAIVGQMNQTGGFVNVSAPIASLTRSGNIVSVVLAGGLAANVNGLAVTIAGVADSSYNGSYVVTTTGNNTFTYAQTGANSSSSGGTAAVLTGGFALYPMAEVLSVYDTATDTVDGAMTLAPNNVAWAVNDPVEQPHYFQELVAADTEYVGQSVPRPSTTLRAGLQYQQNNGPGVIGWSIANASPATNYLGYGGTHGIPYTAYEATGIWSRAMVLTAGENAAFTINCNMHGCGNWNSGYNIFELTSSVGADTFGYAPQTSALTMDFRGTPYTFTPTAFTANTIDVGTLNATTINGSVPVFGASGTTHAAGSVPDPGATAGSARFLREDGSWTVPAGGGSGGGASGVAAITGGTIDGTTIGGTTPASVAATQLNGLPVSEYANVARKPMATLLEALHNANSQPVNIVVLSDSFGICDRTNCSTGPVVSSNRYTEQLRINLQAQYGSHGTGMVPLVGLVGPTLNLEEWAVTGSWSTVNTMGPYQVASFAGSSLVHLSNGAVATFTSSIPYDTINTYCMTNASSGSIAVAIDGVSVGTACGTTSSSATAHAVTSTVASLGTHVTTFTSTGDSYLYAAEGTAGSTGVSVHNLSVGSAAAEWFGLNPATQLAFSDLIPTGTQGVVTMLETNEPGVGYNVASFTGAMNAIVTHELGLAGSPSVMMVVPPVDVIAGTAPYAAAQVAIAQQQNVAFVNVQDRWGTAYVPSSGLWDLGPVATGIHPNDKGARDMYSMVYAQMVDPVPFGAASAGAAGSIAGLVTAGSGISVSGAGTAGSPYTIAAAGGAGGCSGSCTFGGTTTLADTSGAYHPLAMTSNSSAGAYFTLGGSGTGVHLWGFHSQGSGGTAPGDFAVGDFTQGYYPFRIHAGPSSTGASYVTLGLNSGYCWNGNADGATGSPDTCLSRPAAGGLAIGNGTLEDASGSLSAGAISAGVYKGPATAPSGACTVVGWAFSQDGHATFCNGSTWVSKI